MTNVGGGADGDEVRESGWDDGFALGRRSVGHVRVTICGCLVILGVLRVSEFGEESAAQRTSFSKMGKARASFAREEQRWCSVYQHPRRCRRPYHFYIFVTSPHPAPRSFLSDPYPHAHALHVRFLCWFLDAGGAVRPNAPAGVLRMLVEAFSACGLGVSVATDGTLYQTEVFTASAFAGFHTLVAVRDVRFISWALVVVARIQLEEGEGVEKWGDRPVLYETIKLLYTFPQSVGIGAGILHHHTTSAPSSSARRRASALNTAAALFLITRAPLAHLDTVARATLAVPRGRIPSRRMMRSARQRAPRACAAWMIFVFPVLVPRVSSQWLSRTELAEELVHGAADGEEQEERGRRAEVGWKGYSVGRNQLDELGWEAEEGRVSDVPCMDVDILAPSRWIGVE
ncbi:hypothetical protein B0H13DRAFT_2670458 [Mycena leptocephala]|nr:hypothetical protein B0H13DRAFT_2670458 [Mycena leptocephala]